MSMQVILWALLSVLLQPGNLAMIYLAIHTTISLLPEEFGHHHVIITWSKFAYALWNAVHVVSFPELFLTPEQSGVETTTAIIGHVHYCDQLPLLY